MEKQITLIDNETANALFAKIDHLTQLVSELKPKEQEQPKESKYMTRQEVADLFGITLATVHQWTVNSILLAYRVSNRIYYKRSEIEATYQRKTSRKRSNR